MPILRPFRALRFDAARDDIAAVLAPPYDVIGPSERQHLLERHPHNAVRLDLPADLGSEDPEAYRGAARTLAEWRSTSVLVKDASPTLTLHEMRWRDGDSDERRCTGFYARLRLEPFGPGAGVLPHERTLSGPKEDRYRLLRATGLNTSPVVVLAGSDPATTSAAIARLTDGPPDAEATTPDGVRHRVWVHAAPDPGLPGNVDAPPPDALDPDDPTVALLALAGASPVTIADGHHRYETALRYRDERAAKRACESDPAWDYLLALVYPLDQSPLVLPTHRVLRGDPEGETLVETLGGWLGVDPLPDRAALLAAMAEAPATDEGSMGTGRLGLLTRERAAILRVRPEAADALLEASLSEASRGLDVNLLTAVIERAFGADVASLAADGRLAYVKDAGKAAGLVEDGEASSAFLLDPMPPAAIARVAAAGEVMPQKSTYFHPKAPTGLLFSPLEW